MLYVGLVLGVVAGNMAAHAAHLDPLRVYAATLILIIPALSGARLLYVAAEWHIYRRNIRRVWDRKDGGSIMYGGLPAALLVSVPLLRILHLDFPAFWDVASFTMLVGMFFTRIGCLMNGCCSGQVSRTWGMYLPNHEGVQEKRIPTQLLEALWAVILLIFAVAVRGSVPFPGALFLMVSLGYAAGRLGMEFFRERRQTSAGFSIAHVVSLVITFVSISALTIYWKR